VTHNNRCNLQLKSMHCHSIAPHIHVCCLGMVTSVMHIKVFATDVQGLHVAIEPLDTAHCLCYTSRFACSMQISSRRFVEGTHEAKVVYLSLSCILYLTSAVLHKSVSQHQAGCV
jgi:hypothetical protein